MGTTQILATMVAPGASGLLSMSSPSVAASQNVVAAISRGWEAVLAGAGAVALSFALIPLFSRIGPAATPAKTGGNHE